MIKIKLLFIFSVSLVCFQNNFSQKYIEEEIVLDSPTGKIYGTLTLPAKGKKYPVALLISGSGPTDRNGNSSVMPGDNNSLLMLSHELAEKGIANVRYDKRGIGASRKSGFSENDLRFDHYIYDVVFWIRKLRDDKRFKKIGIIGHSEGSLIGMVAATKVNIDFYISLAGAAYPANEIIQQQLKDQPEEIVEGANRILEQLDEGFTVDSVNPLLFSIFRPSVQPYLISWFAYNPVEVIKKLEVPVLIVQGTSDIQVLKENGEILSKASGNAKLFVIENMNHVLKITGDDLEKNIAAYSNPDLPLADELAKTIVTFIKKGK